MYVKLVHFHYRDQLNVQFVLPELIHYLLLILAKNVKQVIIQKKKVNNVLNVKLDIILKKKEHLNVLNVLLVIIHPKVHLNVKNVLMVNIYQMENVLIVSQEHILNQVQLNAINVKLVLFLK